MTGTIARANMNGGYISPLKLIKILETAEAYGNETISLGSRQDILFKVDDPMRSGERGKLFNTDITYEWNSRRYQNIVCSYLSSDILQGTYWLTSSSYMYILESFDYKPELKINITDPEQDLVPLFSGQLNFVASKHEKYWFLYIKLSNDSEQVLWPALVFSHDIANLSKMIEDLVVNQMITDVQDLFEQCNNTLETKSRMIDYSPEFSSGFFPEYEGIKKMLSGNNFWAGFFWRNNNYSIKFLKEICFLCSSSSISRIFITPWKSIVIKDIEQKDIPIWECLIGKYGITMRHSSLELNWHLPIFNDNALKLKQYLVRQLDKKDIRTEGMTIAIAEKSSRPFTTIVIEENPSLGWLKKLGIGQTYKIYIAKKFNTHSPEYELYEESVIKADLRKTIKYISEDFFAQLIEKIAPPVEKEEKFMDDRKFVYQCSHCLTVYDPEVGEPENGIAEGTAFSQLPDDYTCPLCEAEKEDFSYGVLSNATA